MEDIILCSSDSETETETETETESDEEHDDFTYDCIDGGVDCTVCRPNHCQYAYYIETRGRPLQFVVGADKPFSGRATLLYKINDVTPKRKKSRSFFSTAKVASLSFGKRHLDCARLSSPHTYPNPFDSLPEELVCKIIRLCRCPPIIIRLTCKRFDAAMQYLLEKKCLWITSWAELYFAQTFASPRCVEGWFSYKIFKWIKQNIVIPSPENASCPQKLYAKLTTLTRFCLASIRSDDAKVFSTCSSLLFHALKEDSETCGKLNVSPLRSASKLYPYIGRKRDACNVCIRGRLPAVLCPEKCDACEEGHHKVVRNRYTLYVWESCVMYILRWLTLLDEANLARSFLRLIFSTESILSRVAVISDLLTDCVRFNAIKTYNMLWEDAKNGEKLWGGEKHLVNSSYSEDLPELCDEDEYTFMATMSRGSIALNEKVMCRIPKVMISHLIALRHCRREIIIFDYFRHLSKALSRGCMTSIAAELVKIGLGYFNTALIEQAFQFTRRIIDKDILTTVLRIVVLLDPDRRPADSPVLVLDASQRSYCPKGLEDLKNQDEVEYAPTAACWTMRVSREEAERFTCFLLTKFLKYIKQKIDFCWAFLWTIDPSFESRIAKFLLLEPGLIKPEWRGLSPPCIEFESSKFIVGSYNVASLSVAEVSNANMTWHVVSNIYPPGCLSYDRVSNMIYVTIDDCRKDVGMQVSVFCNSGWTNRHIVLHLVGYYDLAYHSIPNCPLAAKFVRYVKFLHSNIFRFETNFY